MIIPTETIEKIDKALELIWIVKDKLSPDISEDDLNSVLGMLRRADNMISNAGFEIADAHDDD